MMLVVGKQFCKEASEILGTCNVRDLELAESHAVSDPIQMHVSALGFFLTLSAPLAKPTAHSLSVRMGVEGWGSLG